MPTLPELAIVNTSVVLFRTASILLVALLNVLLVLNNNPIAVAESATEEVSFRFPSVDIVSYVVIPAVGKFNPEYCI